MGFSSKPFSLFLYSLIFLTNLELIPLAKSVSNTDLVYKQCAEQAFADPHGVYSRALSTLFGFLVSQSSKVWFFNTTYHSGLQIPISGLFQCRGDLTKDECFYCVNELSQMADSLCGKTVTCRVQLLGCYLLYEVSASAQSSAYDLLYNICGSTNVTGGGFQDRRDTALTVLEEKVVNGQGFYTTTYQDVYMLAQCEGDLGDPYCGECVKSAVLRAQDLCGNSISGQVYLQKCFINYNCNPNGVPGISPSSSSSSSSSSGTGGNTGKTVAIILVGAAIVGFLVFYLLFKRN